MPPTLCERSRVLQVVANILGNAVKFSPPGETVRIEARQEHRELVISVVDRGPGIAPDSCLTSSSATSKEGPGRG
jgi:signal transduction histidine kinase